MQATYISFYTHITILHSHAQLLKLLATPSLSTYHRIKFKKKKKKDAGK